MLNRNDIKYILKKVIIILITSFIFFGIHKSVSAESLNQTIDIIQNNSYFSTSTYRPTTHIFDFELSSSFSQNIGSSYNFTISNYVQNNTSSDYTKYIVFYNENLEQYVVSKFSSEVSSYNLVYDEQLGYFTSDYGIPYLLFKYDENLSNYGWNCNGSSTCFMAPSSYNPYSITTNDNKSIGIIQNIGDLALSANNIGLNLDYEIIDTNIENLTINNNPYDDYYGSSVPSNFTKIDLTGYQGLVVVPKDYSLLAVDTIDDEDFYQFDYYYEGCQSYGYFSLQNSSMIVSDISNINVCSSEITLVNGIFPVYYNSVSSLPGIGTQSYQQNAIVIYNRKYDETGIPIYGHTDIYIDTTLYNYELVTDFSNFSSSFTYLDKDGNEFTQVVDNIFSFEQLLENGVNQNDNNNNLSTKQKLDIMLGYIKMPFTFLKSLTSSTCQPLRAQFPHSEQYIEIPCISSVIENHLSSEFLTFFRVIVNGFVIYRVIMSITLFIIAQLNPRDLGLEVVDL